MDTSVFNSTVDMFMLCTSLTTIPPFDMSNVIMMKSMFASCTNLTTVPPLVTKGVATNNSENAFTDCENLKKIDLTEVNIGTGMFYNCKKLKTLVLRRITYAFAPLSLYSTNAFYGTPFAAGGTGGTVYVPQSAIERYQSETNWSSLYAAGTCNFVAIEGSEYE